MSNAKIALLGRNFVVVLVAAVCGLTAMPAVAARVFIPLPTPAGCISTGVKINKHGSAVYNVICNNVIRAYYFDSASRRGIALKLPVGALASEGFDIDDNNFVVGASIFNANGFKRYPTIWSPSGAYNQYPEPTSTEARGVSPTAGAHSVVVGQTGIGTALPQAAQIVPAPLLRIASLHLKQSALNDVNDAGTAVGELNGQAASSVLPGALALLPGFPQGLSSVANAISTQLPNANATIVGAIVSSTPASGCPSSGSAFKITPPAALQMLAPLAGDCIAEAQDVNDNGWVVGFSKSSTNVSRAALFFIAGARDLNGVFRNVILGAGWKTITDVSGVNNNNRVVGTGLNLAGTQQAFVIW